MKRWILLTLLLVFSKRAISHEVLGKEAEKSDLPLYEIGVFTGAGYTPDYPAADHGSMRYVFLPSFFFRGKILRADDQDTPKARILYDDKTDLDLSFSASLPASSKDNEARRGMPDLDWLAEVGPRFVYFPYLNKEKGRIRLGLPLRAVVSSDFERIRYEGYVISPSLLLEKYRFLSDKVNAFINISVNFGNKQIQSYFYTVDREFVTDKRAFYKAQAGYIGTDFWVGSSYKLQDVDLFLGGRIGYYDGAANESSPLFKKYYDGSIFFGLLWMFYESKTRGYQ